MGPPPSIPDWVATATEQQIRYALLLAGGILITVAFGLLANKLRQGSEKPYWMLGLLTMSTALPSYILNMAYWGSFLTESFTNFSASSVAKRPDWYLAMRALFSWISTVEVALIYLATAAFGAALPLSSNVSMTWLPSLPVAPVIKIIVVSFVLLPSS